MHPMSESYDHLLAALRDRSALVHLDIQAPRDAPTKQFMASLFEPAPGEHPKRPQGQAAMLLSITPEQARELLASGAVWHGPAHMRAEVLPDS